MRVPAVAEQQITEMNQAFDGKTVALLRELKLSLYTMARQAELESSGVQTQAEQMMRLIDSYITACQTVYGQQTLPLSPLALGSVMHDVAMEARKEGIRMTIETNAHVTVATHVMTLTSLLHSAAAALKDISGSSMVLRSYISRDQQVGVGVFAHGLSVTDADLRAALGAAGETHMPLAGHSERSGVMLVIADGLAQALGGSLQVKRMGALRGFATVIPRSEQLAML